MSDILKHVVVGDLIGCMAASSKNRVHNNLGTAFALGVLSHAVLDMSEPDYTVNWFSPTALTSSTPFLGFQFAGVGLAFKMLGKNTRDNPRALMIRTAAISGAVIPDIIDGIYSVLNPNAWYSGQLLFPWHVATYQVNPMSMWSTTLLSAMLLLLRYLTLPLYKLMRGMIPKPALK